MYDLKKDWAVFSAAVPDLESYILSSEILLPLVGDNKNASLIGDERLSLGVLLLSQKRLNTARLTGEQAVALNRLNDQVTAVRTQWLSNWQRKASQEFPARVTMWQNYLQDAIKDRDRFKTYAYHVRWRAMLSLLADEFSTNASGSAETRLTSLDQRLKAMFKSAGFVWDETLAAGFPQDEFWFLYLQTG